MASRDLQPSLPDGRRSFHVGATRRVEISLKQELSDVTHRSVAEIAAMNQVKMNQPLTNEQKIVRKLHPEFIHKRARDKIKLHPIFHEDLKPKENSKEDVCIPNVSSYNSLDKDPQQQMLSMTRKYPNMKDKQILMRELQKPHTSSVGVVPNRPSANIPGLNVVLTGSLASCDLYPSGDIRLIKKPASNESEHSASKRSVVKTPERPSSGESTTTELDKDVKDKIMTSKPAIVNTLGTTKNIALCDRRAPTQKPSTLSLKKKSRKRVIEPDMLGDVIRSPLKSGRSITSSLLSQEIVLPDDQVFRKYDAVVADINLDNVRTAVAMGEPKTMMTVQELCDEARMIASPESEPLYRQQIKTKKTEKQKGKKTSTKSKTRPEPLPKKAPKMEKEDSTVSRPSARSERSVDEIISSLRDHSQTGTISEADRRIQEIMGRVMSRSGGVDPGIGAQEETHPSVDQESKEPSPVPDTKSDLPLEEPEVEEQETVEEIKKIPVVQFSPTSTLHHVPEESSSSDEETSDTDPMPMEKEMTEEEHLDIQQVWMDLRAAPEATYEDIVKVEGTRKEIQRNRFAETYTGSRVTFEGTNVSFLSTWAACEKPAEEESAEEQPARKIHHFCTTTAEFQLPKELKNVGRKYHTPDRFSLAFPNQPYRFGIVGPTVPFDYIEEDLDEEDQRISAAAERVLEGVMTTDKENSLEAWQKRANQVFYESELNVEGHKISLRSDETRMYWEPAPPKLNVLPSRVKDMLFPDYSGLTLPQPVEDKESEVASESASEEDDLTDDPDDVEAHNRVLNREYNSCEDLTDYSKEKKNWELITEFKTHQSIEGEIIQFPPPPTDAVEEGPSVVVDLCSTVSVVVSPLGPMAPGSSFAMDCGQSVSTGDRQSHLESISDIEDQKYDSIPRSEPIQRTKSQPELMGIFDDTLLVPQDFNTAIEEIQEQKVQIRQLKQQRILEAEGIGQIEEQESMAEQDLVFQSTMDVRIASEVTKENLTPAEVALEAGRTYVILPKKSKGKKRKPNLARLEVVEEFLKRPPRKIERSASVHAIGRVIEREFRVHEIVRRHRWSIPNLFEFDGYKEMKGYVPNEDEREWVRDIWNEWFDEVYPTTPSTSDDDEYNEDESFNPDSVSSTKDEKSIKKKDSINSMFSDDIESLELNPTSEENAEILQILREEIDKLTSEIDGYEEPLAYDLCRRGGLYRKVGEFKKALTDLDRAIDMEPMLLDAYWHRHLLYILQGKQASALEDLSFIMKNNKQHAGAYRSMAEIYRKNNDSTMAIINYTMAIKLNPMDHETYFRRAQMYEQGGEMLLALEDYSITTKIMPTRTDAIMKRGLYYFENQNWNNAIHDFTNMLRIEPLNAVARLYRGQAHAKQKQWAQAVNDLSAAIHLDPNYWQAYFHRGCILRKSHPQRALLDFSMSVLINDSEENIMCYLHRGILYDALDRPEDAIPDFENVLKLNKDVACAHVNLGLIYMKRYENYHRAIKRFGTAIKVEPTYVRAYVCRAEAYHKIHQLKQALRDYTRAIHLQPDVPNYYMYRGQLVLEMGNMELAEFCVRHAAVLNQNSADSIRQRPNQEAVVQSFLRNYDKAIEALENGTRVSPNGSLFMLLGKTQMKAKRFDDAVKSFESALFHFKPWKLLMPWPPETAEVHFLAGQCNTELGRYLDALENFNSAIKFDSQHAEAFYRRGLTRMKLKQSKGILDLNRALAINPNLFQIFLSRACYYGMKGNYTKAILNCNEALKLQPKSVRAYLYRGALKYYIKAYELAVVDLTKAAKINSTCPLAYFNRAVCYQESNNFHKALQDYGVVLLIGDDLKLKVYINRGLLYFEQKDYGNALYDFQMASKLRSEDHKIHHTLGLCFHKLDLLQKAVETFTHCISLKPFFLDGYICRGNVYMDFGHQQGLVYARRDYQRALALDPVCLPARVNLAYTMQVDGKFMAAWKHFTCAITINPEYKPGLEGRAIVNLQMSDTFAAFQDITASINVKPTAELLTNRGVINQFMNDRVNAMKDYQSAILMDPKYSLAYFNGANMYFYGRHFKQALGYYTKAIQHNPRDESAFLNRAITKVLLRDAQSALADFKMAIKLSPKSAHMYFNRGNLYSSMQEYEKAEKDYSKALYLQPDDALVLKRRADVRGKLGNRADAIADYKLAIDIQTRPHKK